MPIFLDNSKRRKIYFRALAVFFIFSLLGFVLLFLFGLSFATGSRASMAYANVAERYHYYYSGNNTNKVALTIDDGPNPDVSEAVFAALKAAQVPATFFYVGKSVLLHPDIVKEASDDGFAVENHSFTEGEGVQGSYQRLALELNSTGYLLSQISGTSPAYYRPPFLLNIGADPTINPYIAPPQQLLWSMELGYLPIGADIDPNTWYATSTPGVVADLARAMEAKPNGHIIGLHENEVDAKALPGIIAYLKENGYSIVPLAQLLTPPTETALGTTLSLGDTDTKTNGEVSKLQWFLYEQKYLDPYSLTGVYDQATRAAVLNFQTRNKLVDPANPDPRVSGVAEAKTRALIYSMSLANAPAPAPVELANTGSIPWWASAIAFLGDTMRSGYVHIFPVAFAALLGMTIVTLALVGFRTVGLISLLIYGALRRKREVPLDLSETRGISVLIPAYNEEENIAATVESVIRSSYAKREIIVIDDGSKDDTSGEVQAVIDAYPQDEVRLIRKENGGKADALNVGVAASKHDLIAVLDADAVLDKAALGHFVKHFADLRVGAVAGKVRTTGRARMLDLFQTLEYAIGQNIDKRAFSAIGAVGVVPGPAGAWRRSYILQLGGFSTQTLVEDQDMTLTILHAGKRVVYEPDAIAYTETPHTVTNFLKQRFRWVYGTMQCFWKHKSMMVEHPLSAMSLVVLPNVFIYNIFLPLAYPFADASFIFGLVFGNLHALLLPFLLFTAFDLSYAFWGAWREPGAWRLMIAVPLQRVVYRQLLYYTVMRGVIRAFEGTGSSWNKFRKVGETKRFYVSDMLVPVPSPLSAEGMGAPEPIKQESMSGVVSLSALPAPFQSMSDTTQ